MIRTDNSLGKSAEDYLKQILLLQNKNGFARSIELAISFGYTKASVCNAIKNLINKQLVIMRDDKTIYLTEDGRKAAERVYNKYRVIYSYLTDCLNVDAKIAAKDACKMEHIVSDFTCTCLAAMHDEAVYS